MRSRTRRHVAIGTLAVCAAALALHASRQSGDDGTEDLSLAAPRRAPVVQAVPVPAPEAAAKANADTDPFAPRGWDAVAAPVVVASAPVVPVIVVPVAAPPAPVAPALPFAFMGRMNDGTSNLVYLSRGEESWTVKGGETLDANYKIVSMTPQQIVFEHLPTGTQQTLALPEPDK